MAQVLQRLLVVAAIPHLVQVQLLAAVAEVATMAGTVLVVVQAVAAVAEMLAHQEALVQVGKVMLVGVEQLVKRAAEVVALALLQQIKMVVLV